MLKGSGCGSFGRAVASNTRDSRFESSHWQNFKPTYLRLIVEITLEKTKKQKEAGNGTFYKTI